MEKDFSNREIKLMFENAEAKQDSDHQRLQTSIEGLYSGQVQMLKEVKYTNGKVRLHTKVLIAIAAVLGAIILMKPELLVTVAPLIHAL